MSLRSKPLEILERGQYVLRLMQAARRVVGLAALSGRKADVDTLETDLTAWILS